MTREPVIERGKVIGHNVTREAFYIRTRDARGYESIQLLHWPTTVFEPVKRQRGMFEDED